MENTRDDVMRLRGEAFDAYAVLESALCDLMRVLGRIPIKSARPIFYAMTNSRLRNHALTDLKVNKFGQKYNLFWNSLMRLINDIDTTRNQIAHWHTRQSVAVGGKAGTRVDVSLYPGNLKQGSPELTKSDLEEFIKKANFAVTCLLAFRQFARFGDAADLGPSWLEIFQEPLTHPGPQ